MNCLRRSRTPPRAAMSKGFFFVLPGRSTAASCFREKKKKIPPFFIYHSFFSSPSYRRGLNVIKHIISATAPTTAGRPRGRRFAFVKWTGEDRRGAVYAKKSHVIRLLLGNRGRECFFFAQHFLAFLLPSSGSPRTSRNLSTAFFVPQKCSSFVNDRVL